MDIFSNLLRAGEGKRLRLLTEVVGAINNIEPEMEGLSDEELQNKTNEFKERLSGGEDLDDLLIEAFAVVREAAWRVMGQRHFDVQLMGGMALHFGWIAEMKTGEGKTLVSTLPVYLNALTGRGVHVITANDYLATRDAQTMGVLHNWLGLSVGRVGPDITDVELKKEAYNSDITYGTNNGFGFDYLRDNMALEKSQIVQREHVFAIIDEIDSILIDEARTPLIISGASKQSTQMVFQFATIARTLVLDEDYSVDEAKKNISILEPGIEKVEKMLGIQNLYELDSVEYVHHLEQAITARALYRKDMDYLVEDGEVKIIDEFTGRTMDGRRWSSGLHQAIEAKERVTLIDENHTWATVTIQNYFLLYEKLSGMTGTAKTEESEFASIYNLTIVPIPTNEPSRRLDKQDLTYKSEVEKFEAIAEDAAQRHASGQPILIGTASVSKSELLSKVLTSKGIPHEVLNAKQHFREAEVIAQAGRLGAVTVATNMAGRGVDILLGGNPEHLAVQTLISEGLSPEDDRWNERFNEIYPPLEAQCRKDGEKVREIGGLYVLGSERHESRRIDDQLRGRSGRQGEPGESRFVLSLEDEMMRIFSTGTLGRVLESSFPDGEPLKSKMVASAVEKAQSAVEGINTKARKEVFDYDDVLDKQRKVIYGLRRKIIDGEDLEGRTLELLKSAIDEVILMAAPGSYPEDWNIEELVFRVSRYYPTKFEIEDLLMAKTQDQLYESIMTEAVEFYENRRAGFPGGLEQANQVEREVMLGVIDEYWRDHLGAMDNLREGIGLRASAQTNPLTAWKQDGYRLFEELIANIHNVYLRHVFHVALKEAPDLEPTGKFQVADGVAALMAEAANKS